MVKPGPVLIAVLVLVPGEDGKPRVVVRFRVRGHDSGATGNGGIVFDQWQPPTLSGARVLVRPLRPDDAPAVFAAIDASRQYLAPWVGWTGVHRSVANSRRFCEERQHGWTSDGELTLGIFDRTTGQFLGCTGFHRPDPELRAFEIGYWLSETATGHGYATEATRLLVDHAFGAWRARRVELRCDALNTASANVARRAGFVLEGVLRASALDPAGEPRDTMVFALLPADWRRLSTPENNRDPESTRG